MWYRQCPSCSRTIEYPYQSNFCRAKRTNAKCAWCAHDGQLIGRVQTEGEKERRAIKLRGKVRSLESRKRYSKSKRGKNSPRYGDHRLKSVEHRRKIRLSCIQRIEDRLKHLGKSMSPTFNLNACRIIDEYGKKHGYNFQHALNGGEHRIKELGYWVDGYDKEKNVVIEYYENNHWHRNNKEKDLDRRMEIMHHMGCEFIILREEVGGNYLPEHFCRQKGMDSASLG